MSFTNEDLKRLKELREIMADGFPRGSVEDHVTFLKFKLDALLARLEAAEEMFSHSLPNRGELCYFCKITYEHALNCPLIAWRKACGK